MARGKQLRSRFIEPTADVTDWVEDQQHSTTSDNLRESPNAGFVSQLFQACLHALMELSKYCRTTGRDRAQQIRVQDELANLVLWGDVCEEGKVDACLRKSQELHDSVVEILHGIGQTLNKGVYKTANIDHNEANQPLISARKDLEGLLEKAELMRSLQLDNGQSGLPAEGFESEEEETSRLRLESRMHNYVTCLMDLAPTIQRVMGEQDVSLEGRRNSSDVAKFHVSQAARQYVLRIVDKYKNADHRLVERLGEANWQRYVHIQRQIQSTREAEGGGDDDDDGDDGDHHDHHEREIGQRAKSNFVPLSKFHDSGLGSSKPTRSSYAVSVASHTSFASTQSDAPGGRLRVPPTPPEVAQGLFFPCYICGDVLTDVNNRIDWKIHIFRDLQPYICTFSGCNESLVIFPTRKLWFEHELTNHRAKSLFECHECLRQFDTETAFLNHHELDHSRYFNKLQRQANISSARKYLPLVLEEQQCPLCLQSQWASQRQFVTHLGRHMEEIALASLPRDAASDSEAGSSSESDVEAFRRQRSKSELPRSSGKLSAKPGLAELMSHYGGPPVPTLASPMQERPAAEKRSDDDDEADEDEDGLSVIEGVKVDFKTRVENIIPTLEGFKTHATQLNPRLEPFLIERIAQEQVRRYQNLIENKIKHAQDVYGTKECSSGKHCFELGGNGESDNDGTTFADGVVTAALFPQGIPLPPVKRLPAEFECSLCLKVKKFQKPSDWIKHIYEDVRPFTCTFPNCTEPKSFKRKADWVRHENERHRHLEWWKCNIPDCNHKCYRKDNFVQHLVREHKKPEPKVKSRGFSSSKAESANDEDSLKALRVRVQEEFWQLVDTCRFETKQKPREEVCKFCGNLSSSWKKLTVHLAKHMEQIAMPVLELVRQREVLREI